MMVTKGQSFAGRIQWYRFGYVAHGFKDIIVGNPTTPQWLPMRKTAFRAIHRHGADLNRIKTVLATRVKDFIKKLTSYVCNTKPVDFRDDVYSFVAKVAVIMLVGCQPKDDDVLLIETKRFEELVRESTESHNEHGMRIFPMTSLF